MVNYVKISRGTQVETMLLIAYMCNGRKKYEMMFTHSMGTQGRKGDPGSRLSIWTFE
jgi:hypothetical protein